MSVSVSVRGCMWVCSRGNLLKKVTYTILKKSQEKSQKVIVKVKKSEGKVKKSLKSQKVTEKTAESHEKSQKVTDEKSKSHRKSQEEKSHV